MMTVGDFYTDLRRMAKRGSALDEELPGALRRAVRWVEQNYTLQYMKKALWLTLESGTTQFDLPGSVKSIISLGWRFPDGSGSPLARKDFESFTPSYFRTYADVEVPNTYYVDGAQTIVLSGTAAGNIAGQLVRYSPFPLAPTESHWLLQNAESLLRAQSMLELAAFNRDDRSYQIMMMMREEQIKVLMNADYEARYSNQDIVLGEG